MPDKKVSTLNLEKVAKENPAIRIIQQAIENKPRNNPEKKLNSFKP